MGNITSTFLRGLGVILPVALTIWVVIWLATATEALLKPLFLLILPEAYYLPGLGLVTGLALAYAVGVLVNVFFVRTLWEAFQNGIERIPLVKTIFAAIRDFFDFFSSAPTGENSMVVKVNVGNDSYVIGFVTDQNPSSMMTDSDTTSRIAVYLPLSYMIGGITLMVPRSAVETLPIGAEEAMRLVLTAGIQKRD
jgi:uncharacterized membrane protein